MNPQRTKSIIVDSIRIKRRRNSFVSVLEVFFFLFFHIFYYGYVEVSSP